MGLFALDGFAVAIRAAERLVTKDILQMLSTVVFYPNVSYKFASNT
jgi:hypothetical protein